MLSYGTTYSRITDDQLLNLAGEAGSLVLEARIALDAELEKRGFRPQDVLRRAEQLRVRSLEAKQRKPFAQSLNGFGTAIYGKRGFEVDGSFLTTKWIVLFWVPLFPLQSLRVRYMGPGGRTALPGWSRRYLVLGESSPNILQVMSAYLYVGSLLIGAWVLDSINFRSRELESSMTSTALGLWLAVPWILRRRSRYCARNSYRCGGATSVWEVSARSRLSVIIANLSLAKPDYDGAIGSLRDLAADIRRKNLFKRVEPGGASPTMDRKAFEVWSELESAEVALRQKNVPTAVEHARAALKILS